LKVVPVFYKVKYHRDTSGSGSTAPRFFISALGVCE